MNSPNVSAVIDRDAQTHAALTHLSGIVSFFVIPLVVYLMQQDKSSVLADAAREALNCMRPANPPLVERAQWSREVLAAFQR